MATHNQVRLVGFLLNDPVVNVANKTVYFAIRTRRREIAGILGDVGVYQDVLIYYNSDDLFLFERIARLKKWDLIDLKGVICILITAKKRECPCCHDPNVKNDGKIFSVFPNHFTKLDYLKGNAEYDENLPLEILTKYYKEVSNQALIIGTVVSEPKAIDNKEKGITCTRYQVGINRKYIIRTQRGIMDDYPWVYSYGKQAEGDRKYLVPQAVILVDAAICQRKVKYKVTCEKCGTEFEVTDTIGQLVTYAVEYLSGHITDEEKEAIREQKRAERILQRIDAAEGE